MNLSRLQSPVKVPYRPGLLFLWFLLAHSLLSFPNLGLRSRFLLVSVGLILPFFLFLGSPDKSRNGAAAGPWKRDWFPAPTPWLLGFLVLLAFLTRFGGLTRLFLWPNWDESLKGILAYQALEPDRFYFFNGFNQTPPVFIGAVALGLKLKGSPLFSLWFPSALVSFLSIFMAFAAARKFFSSSFSLIITLVIAFSYWPLFTGRLGDVWALLILWESLLFYLLGWFLLPASTPVRTSRYFLWGAALGAGSLLVPTWFVTSAGMGLWFLVHQFRKKKGLGWMPPFAAGLLLALLPFLVAAWFEGYGGHLRASGLWNFFDQTWAPLLCAWDYLSVLLWGGKAAYLPSQGGLFNPLWDAALTLGLLEALKAWRQPLARNVLFFLLLFTLPVFFGTLEPFRILQVLPLFAVLIAIGAHAVLTTRTRTGKMLFLSLGMVLACGLDAGRLVAPYWGGAQNEKGFLSTQKSLEKFTAFRTLEGLKKDRGPGVVLSEWVPGQHDLSLAYMTYPDNGIQVRELDPQRHHWVAFVAPVHYLPHLAKRFPGIQGTLLPSQVPGRVSDRFLGVLPLTADNRGELQEWLRGYRLLWEAEGRIPALSNGRSIEKVLALLKSYYPDLPKDPFVQSCFFEKLLDHVSWERNFHPEDLGAKGKELDAILEESYRLGYQDEVLKGKYGSMRVR